ncbi:hypothetical protein AVEN_74399-1 [Araneus ventricosus]|uniref:Uncharacterized protein n=1 Tax=Araneus ventricosus TaxID=182803 RepID=A0A4Y2HFP0_ARAVE|nr:hypothetical protein AVEN_74399-1 [Araneus ventricosus]
MSSTSSEEDEDVTMFVPKKPSGFKTGLIQIFQFAARSILKSIIKNSGLRRWQEEWDNGSTGRSIHRILPKVSLTSAPWNRLDIIFATAHCSFLSYFKRFRIKESDCCGCVEVGDPLHYATSFPFTASSHLTIPTHDLETVWWNEVMENKLSRIKTRNLVKFLLDNESFVSPDPDSEQFPNLHPSSTHLP